MGNRACISEGDLRAFLRGELPEPAGQEIAEHLEHCPSCEALARRFDHLTDPAIRALRRVLHATSAAGSARHTRPPEDTSAGDGPTPLAEGGLPSLPNFELLEEVGRGGMGVVYKARQLHPSRLVALKMILAGGHAAPERRARFLAEADAIARLSHPNIVRVYEVGQHQGLPYLALEYVPGGSLAEHSGGRPQPPRQSAALVEALARAVQHAHEHGVIHRDLKPANVLLDEGGQPKVGDFGLARYERPQLTGSGAVLGTPSYMAPEQAHGDGKQVGPACDIYALGAVLYELLTGQPPFQGGNPLEVLLRVQQQEPIPPSQLQPHTPRDLSLVCMKCLQKEPRQRYASARDLADDLRNFLDDRPVRARAAGATERAWRWARRNPGRAALLALLLVVATASTVLSLWLHDALSQSQKRLERAERAEQEAVDSLNDARAAVQQMLTRVSEESLHDMPQMEPVRRDVLENALTFYQKFLQRKSGDRGIRQETALAYRRLGSVYYRLGEYKKAEDSYRTGFAMLDQLDAESPLDGDTRGEVVTACIGFSWVLGNQGKTQEASRAIRRAVAVADGLVKECPHSSRFRVLLAYAGNSLAGVIAGTMPDEAEKILRRNLTLTEGSTSLRERAQTYRALSVLLSGKRRFPEAEDAGRQGVQLVEQALAKSPRATMLQVDLCGALRDLARVVDAAGRPEEAEAILRRAIPVSDELAADFPAGPHNRWGQADIHFQHAQLLTRLDRPTEAEKEFRLTVDLFDRLARDFPTLPGYRATAVDRRHHLAQFLADAGRVQEAEQVSEQAAALLDQLPPPDRQAALKTRVHLHAGLGQWNRAIADLAKVIALGSADSPEVGCVQAFLHLGAGRMDEYRRDCERLLARFGRGENQYVAMTCCLARNAVTDLSAPVRMAEKLLSREPHNAEHIALLGVALYRKGDPKGAAARLEESLRAKARGDHAGKLVLAMAYHDLGRRAEARRLFEEVTRWLEEDARKKPHQRGDLGVPLPWAYRMIVRTLHREAEDVLRQD